MPRDCVIGRHGLIGGALAAALDAPTSFPIPGETRCVFNFGSYTHLKFNRSPEYQTELALLQARTLLEWCRRYDALYVYPSSALVYEPDTEFSRLKKALEAMADLHSGARTLGLRIFPVYSGSRDDKTIIAQTVRWAAKDISPVFYGDGTQTRDFIHIRDVVAQTLYAVEHHAGGVELWDIGTGSATSFLSLMALVNEELGTMIRPQFAPAPEGYNTGAGPVAGVGCWIPPCPAKVSVRQGIRMVV